MPFPALGLCGEVIPLAAKLAPVSKMHSPPPMPLLFDRSSPWSKAVTVGVVGGGSAKSLMVLGGKHFAEIFFSIFFQKVLLFALLLNVN
jgi:hypothetical protein